MSHSDTSGPVLFYYVTDLKITVTGTKPNGSPIGGLEFADQAWLDSPHDSGQSWYDLLSYLYDVITGLAPHGASELLKYGQQSTESGWSYNETTTWAEWRWNGWIWTRASNKGLQFRFSLHCDPNLTGIYTLNVKYHVEICALTANLNYILAVKKDFYETITYYFGEPKLSISASTGGTTDPAPGTYTYDYGSPVTATASAYTDYAFDYWLLDGATVFENPITVMMDSDHILNAYFERIYTLTVIVQGPGVVRKAIAETSTISKSQMPGYGVVLGMSASYATARTTPSRSVTESLGVCQSYSSYENCYTVERSFLKFNTTTVPSDAIITSAHLSLWGYDDGSRDWSAVIQKWTGDNPLDTNDYNQFDGTNYGSRDLSSWVDYSYNDISISNFALIQKAGYTKICLRSSNDISSIAPTDFETLTIDDWILRYPPKLVITYTYYALGEEVTGSKGYPEGTAVTLKAVPTGALSYWLLDGATVHNNPITVTMDADHNLEAYFKWVGPRYFRGDQQTINGLSAYILGTSQSSTLQFASGMASGRLAVLWSSDVVVRHADGSETTIGTKIAQVSRGSNTEGIQSASWTCPLTSLVSTDAVVIKVYDKYGAAGAWNLRATFITEQLGASQLGNVAWTFYYYTYRLYDGSDTYGDFIWGTSTYNSRIENFTWTP